jgi:hypothetical protein
MTEQEHRRIRAKMTNAFVDYLHNDLSTAAWFFRERINAGFAGKQRADGLFLDMMAAAVMIAFSLEGYANFLGERVLGGSFEERASVVEKLKSVRRALGMEVDWNKRPYSTARKIIALRDTLAHPKAHRAEPQEWEAVGTESELKKVLRDHKPDYERAITQDFINTAYDDVEAIWDEMLKAAKIEVHETWSHGSQGIEFIEQVAPEAQP